MKGSSILAILFVGLLPTIVLGLVVAVPYYGPGLVKWQSPIVWRSNIGFTGNGVNIAEDARAMYVSGAKFVPYGGLGETFLVKYDFAGNQIWSRDVGPSRIHNLYPPDPEGVRIDKLSIGHDGIYLIATKGDITTPYYTTVVTTFIQKYDFNGEKVWEHPIANVTSDDTDSLFSTSDLSAGPNGIYLVGYPDVFPGGKPFPVILRQYDLNGNTVWTRPVANLSRDEVTRDYISMSPDAVYVGLSPYFDQSYHPSSSDLRNSHAFVSRYDIGGTLVWTRQLGNLNSPECGCTLAGLSSDSTGVYVSGSTFNGSLSGENSFKGSGSFVQKYDTNGNVVWTEGEAGHYLEQASGDSGGIYSLSVAGTGTIARGYALDKGRQLWSTSLPQPVLGFLSDSKGVYAVASFSTRDQYESDLVSYSKSNSLVLAGIQPPFSFLTLGTIIAIPIVGILVRVLTRRNRPKSNHPGRAGRYPGWVDKAVA